MPVAMPEERRNLVPEKRFPFATLVTGDGYDTFLELNRSGVFA